MPAALDVNIPNYARAMVSTNRRRRALCPHLRHQCAVVVRERREGMRLSPAPRAIQCLLVSSRSSSRPSGARPSGHCVSGSAGVGCVRAAPPHAVHASLNVKPCGAKRCRNGATVSADASSAGSPSPSPLPSRTSGRRHGAGVRRSPQSCGGSEQRTVRGHAIESGTKV